jgi:hypothetical protein
METRSAPRGAPEIGHQARSEGELTALVRQKCCVADLRFAFRCRPEPWAALYPR